MMTNLAPIGRMVMVLGVVLVLVGAFITVLGRGIRVPGDIVITRDTHVIYIPLATSIILSVLLTLVLSLVARR